MSLFYKHTMSDDSCYSIQGPQMFLGRSESAERCSVGGISSSLDIKFFSNPTNILRLVIYHREHSTQKEQVAGQYSFDVGAKRRWGTGEFNPKVLQSALLAFRL